MFDEHANFAYTTVATAPGLNGTSLGVLEGDGELFQAPPFNCTIWPINTQALSTNAEIVRVTAITGDIFTIEREQEGTTAQNITTDYQISNSITVKVFTDIEAVAGQVATTGSPGIIQLSGDLGGTATTPLVKRTNRFIVAPYGSPYPADYYCQTTNSNDTEINAALTAAGALPNGGVVDLLAGTFVLSHPIVPPNNVWLRGQGMFNTRLQMTPTANAAHIDNFSLHSPSSPWLNAIVSDMELDGSTMNPAVASKGINSTSVNNCQFLNLYVHDTTATGIGTDDPNGSLFANSIVVNCGYTNKRTITAASWSANTITFTTATPHGYTAGTSRITVSGMTPAAYNGFLFIVTSVIDSTHFTVSSSNNGGALNLVIDPGTATAFGVSSDNLIGHNGIGIASGSQASEATIVTNNYCSGNQNNNYLIEADTTGTGANASYIFTDNISVGAGSVGYQNTGTPNAQFNNNFDFGSQLGAQVTVVSQSRTLTAATWSAGVATFTISSAYTYTVGSKVSVNGVTPTGYNGYWTVTSQPTTTTYTVNIPNDPGGSGTIFGSSSTVVHKCDGSSFINNIFSGNGLYGIKVPTLSDGLIIQGNTVKNCLQYGIYLSASNLIFSGNRVYGNGADGIYVITGSGNNTPISHIDISGNFVYNNSQRVANSDGIEVNASSTASINDVTISGNHCYDNQDTKTQRYGVILRSGGTLTNIVVNDNDLSGNMIGPILVQNTSNTIYVDDIVGINPNGPVNLGNISGSITFDVSQNNLFIGTLTGNLTPVMPTPPISGTKMTWILSQDNTGSHTLSLPVNSTTGTTLTLSTAANAVDILNWVYDAVGGKWRLISRQLGNASISTLNNLVITTPSGNNTVSLNLTQNDTTNNPDAADITNAGTANGFKVAQNGVLAANKYGLFIDSSVAQVNAPIVRFRQNNASSTQATLQLDNIGSGAAIDIKSGGISLEGGNLNMTGGTNIVASTVAGTNIGTAANQKLAFYGATPLVQSVLATGASHTVDDVITALQNLGLVRQS